MLNARDGEIETMMAHEKDFFFWCFVGVRLRAIFALSNGCSSIGNESTPSNEVTPSAI